MDYHLNGQLACVFAGAHGIGAAIADLLAAEGASVIVADHDAEGLAHRSQGWRASIVADLATAEGMTSAVAAVLDKFGRAPDILINNLGVGNSTPFEGVTDEAWSASFQVNLMGT